jgi:hypothetical protein
VNRPRLPIGPRGFFSAFIRPAQIPAVLVALVLAVFFVAGCRRSDDAAKNATGTNVVKTAKGPTNAPVANRPVANPANAARPNVPGGPMGPNGRPGGPGILMRTNSPAMARPGPQTNAAALATAKARNGTNAVAGAAKAAPAAGGAGKFRAFLDSSYFYPAVVLLAIGISFGAVFLYQKLSGQSGSGTPGGAGASSAIARPLVKKKRRAPVTGCNVLEGTAATRHLWQFNARGRGFVLAREHTSAAGQSLPARVINKDWTALWQRKLNIAWLPPEQVFVRVAQLPASDFDETVSMVELQLEKLSPMPVTQVVWSIQILPHAEGNLQTVVVMIVARGVVEEYLGKLEGEGFMADRLELPRLDQLLATAATSDGAWIYPEAGAEASTALIAWWYGGVLQSLALINFAPKANPEILKEQLVQLSWAGELEGWLTGPPSWHLVADGVTAAEWEPALRAALDQPVEVVPALTQAELAARTAARAVQTEPQANLLPVEYSTRYHQLFVDRLWMGGVGAVIMLYIACVVIYFARLGWENMKTSKVDAEIAQVGPIYTNAIQLKAKYDILKDRSDLKWAALDCWMAIAALLPTDVSVDGFNLTDGKRLALNGSAPAGKEKIMIDFDSDLRKARNKDNQMLFDPIEGEHITFRPGPNGTVNWNCILELKQGDDL